MNQMAQTDVKAGGLLRRKWAEYRQRKKRAKFLLQRRRALRDPKKAWSLFLLSLPAIALTLVFRYVPIYGLVIAFQDFSIYKGFFTSPFVGLKHFEAFLSAPKFWTVLQNTLITSGLDLIFGFTAPIIFALLANEIGSRKFKRTMQTISYLPHFLSWVVVSALIHMILSPDAGLVNNVRVLLGLEKVSFMTMQSWFRPIVVFSAIWKGVGWGSILYFSVITGIDPQLYDAARIDGAGRFQQAIHITLPGMAPMIVLQLLLTLAQLFNVGFERIFLLMNAITEPIGNVISTYVYGLGIEQYKYSLTTAIGLTQSILSFVLLTSSNALAKRISGLGLY